MPRSATVTVHLSRAQAKAIVQLIAACRGGMPSALERSLRYASKTIRAALDA